MGGAARLPRAAAGGAPPHRRGDPRAATRRPRARRCAATSPARSSATASSPPSAATPQREDPADPFAGGARQLLRRAGAGRLAESGRGEAAIEERASLEGEALIAAATDCDLIVSYRQSPGPAAVFERLPKLRAFLRCAIDIRNVDVAGGEQGRRAGDAGERRLRHLGHRAGARLPGRPCRAASRATRTCYHARQGAAGVHGHAS